MSLYLDDDFVSAAAAGDLKTVERLLSGNQIFCVDRALCSASSAGFIRIVEVLLENGADVHFSNDHPLYWASYHGHIAVVEMLLKNGANVHSRNDGALWSACQNKNISLIVKLLRAGASLNVLHEYWIDLTGEEASWSLSQITVDEVVDLLASNLVRQELA